MAGAFIELKVNDQEMQALFGKLLRRFGNLRPAMEILGETGLVSIQDNFEAGGRPKSWAALKDTTIAERKRENKWPGRILVRKGTAGGLLGSIIYRAGSDRVVWSANKKYAATHHFGAAKGSFGTVMAKVGAHPMKLKSGRTVSVKAHTRKQKMPWGNIPARPFMVIQDEALKEMKEALKDYLLKS